MNEVQILSKEANLKRERNIVKILDEKILKLINIKRNESFNRYLHTILKKHIKG